MEAVRQVSGSLEAGYGQERKVGGKRGRSEAGEAGHRQVGNHGSLRAGLVGIK